MRPSRKEKEMPKLTKLLELIKKNKGISLIILLLVVFFLSTHLMKHKTPRNKSQAALSSMSNSTNSSSSDPDNSDEPHDEATGDNTAESLNALTQELHQVISSNKALQASNADLNKQNAGILANIKDEVQKYLDQELQKRGQDNTQKIQELETELTQVNDAIKKANKQKSEGLDGSYSVDRESQGSGSNQEVSVNGEKLVAIPDIAGAHSRFSRDFHGANNSELNGSNNNDATGTATAGSSGGANTTNGSSGNNGDSLLHPAGSDNQSTQNQSGENSQNGQTNNVPYYTIPSGATLASSVSMTALIGRVPVNGVVKSPYPFKMIIGPNNMAANGLHIPGVNGAIIQGYTVGDMELSCVKGYITAITFVFPDGRISTSSLPPSSNESDIGFNDSLGYISESNGNPCFPGKFYTNAPEYLATMITLGALNQGGQAYSTAQQTSMSNAIGGTTTSLTGSVGKFMLGGAVQGSTQQAMDWFTAREKDSFDAVYVPAGQKAVINIVKEIAIDYDQNGRKIYYAHEKNRKNNTSLD